MAANQNDRPTFRLTIQALPDRVPVDSRLKRLVKLTLRGFGFRLLRLEDLQAGSPPTGPTAAREQ